MALLMITLINDRYTYRISWSEEDREYVGLCAEFPSLSWLDETPEEALKGIRQVVAEVVSDMQNEGEQIPTCRFVTLTSLCEVFSI